MNDKIDNMSAEELEQEMEKILAELEEHPESANWEPPKEIDEKIFAEIRKREDERARAQLSDEDKKLLSYGKIYKKQMRRRKYWVLAAVLVMALAVGMTSVGGPKKLLQKMTRDLSGRTVVLVDSDDGNIVDAGDLDEEQAYGEAEEKFGFTPVKLDYLPEGVGFSGILLGDEIQGVQLFYAKDEKLIIEFRMQVNHRTGSMGFDVEDVLQETYFLKNNSVEIEAKCYYVRELGECRWVASFIYQDVNYSLIAHDMQKEEFEKIVNNLVMK